MIDGEVDIVLGNVAAKYSNSNTVCVDIELYLIPIFCTPCFNPSRGMHAGRSNANLGLFKNGFFTQFLNEP